MPAPANLVHQQSTTTGTGNFTLSAVNGKQSFATAFGTGASTDVFDYFISNQSASEWERGTGHMSDATTLVRDTVIESTNSNAAVNFSSGTKDVANDIPAAKQVGTDLTQTLTNKTYDTAGTGNVFKINGTQVSAITGTGSAVLATSPTLSTPNISSIVNTGTLTLPTSTDTLVGRATTDTFTNKRITPRVQSDTSNSATPTLNTDNYDMDVITGQTNNITSMTTNLSGTPVNGQKLLISFTASSGSPTITWGTSFESSTVTLPTSMSTTRSDVGFIWNAATSKWRCVATA